MEYREVRQNLFTVDKKYYLAHCISADAKMGAGIAVEFAKKYPKIKSLQQQRLVIGSCVHIDRVLNLVTKGVYYGKPTYESLRMSLDSCKRVCIDSNIKYLAMPKIGCGLDRLSWGEVRLIIGEVFQGMEIEILVCSL